MLEPDSPVSRAILWAVLLGMLVLHVVRSVRLDRREYRPVQALPHYPQTAAAGLMIGIFALTVVGVVAVRKEKDQPTIGDIRSMLPRNRQELVLGGLLSVNAGVFEELLFRLALPALVFGATGSALAAVLTSVLLFGALHVYQGPAGIIGMWLWRQCLDFPRRLMGGGSPSHGIHGGPPSYAWHSFSIPGVA